MATPPASANSSYQTTTSTNAETLQHGNGEARESVKELNHEALQVAIALSLVGGGEDGWKGYDGEARRLARWHFVTEREDASHAFLDKILTRALAHEPVAMSGRVSALTPRRRPKAIGFFRNTASTSP
ncbi:hypothetical protein OF83DRAFT_1178248 [Amylostereum chailletii]|nr:hypothetical protein OF83DRAFT_1178248 [Amylostereum chailletii]